MTSYVHLHKYVQYMQYRNMYIICRRKHKALTCKAFIYTVIIQTAGGEV